MSSHDLKAGISDEPVIIQSSRGIIKWSGNVYAGRTCYASECNEAIILFRIHNQTQTVGSVTLPCRCGCWQLHNNGGLTRFERTERDVRNLGRLRRGTGGGSDGKHPYGTKEKINRGRSDHKRFSIEEEEEGGA